MVCKIYNVHYKNIHKPTDKFLGQIQKKQYLIAYVFFIVFLFAVEMCRFKVYRVLHAWSGFRIPYDL